MYIILYILPAILVENVAGASSMHRRILEGYIKYFKYGLEGERNYLHKLFKTNKRGKNI